MTCPLISEVYRVENERFLNLKPPCKLRESSSIMSTDLRGIQGENKRFLHLKPPHTLRESSCDMSTDLKGIQGGKQTFFCIQNHPVNIENHQVTCPLISKVYRVENKRFLHLIPPCKH